MDRKNIEKLAQTPEDKLLLARLWDKINSGIQKNIPVHTCFLSPRELMLARYLFGSCQGLHCFGGYHQAERCMYVYLPDYLDSSYLMQEASPVICLQASFYKDETPTHRDFLGALIGCGIDRQCIGDILVGESGCVFFVTEEIADYILQTLDKVGRTAVTLCAVPLQSVTVPQQKFTQLRDTVASLRLDSILSSGFCISRADAAERILAGKAAIDGLPCDKPDKTVSQGSKISLRGLGKIRLEQIGHTTKKGRISVVIHRYE